MGVTDEHWCSLCHKKLDKARDKYLDFELIHQAAAPVIKKWKKPKGLICMECIEKDPKLKELVDAILAAGNPPFLVDVTCRSWNVCSTYQPSTKPNVNCRHIAVIEDTVYCKRSHPGSVKLMVERAEKTRVEVQAATRMLRRAFRNLPEDIRVSAETAFEQAVKGSWRPPSSVVKVAEGDPSSLASAKLVSITQPAARS